MKSTLAGILDVYVLSLRYLSLIIAPILFVNIFSCCKDDNSIKHWVKPLWEFNLHKQGPQHNSIIDANLCFNNKVIIATTDGPDNRYISCVDMEFGKELWKWNDIYQPPTEFFDIGYVLFYDNLMFYQVGTRSYCINLNDGTTHFKKRGFISYHSRFATFESNAILLGDMLDSISGETAYGVNFLEIHTGNINPLLVPPLDSDLINTEYHGIGDFSSAITAKNGNYLITTYGYQDSSHNVIPKLGVYDLMNKNWLYKNKKLTENPKWSTSVNILPIFFEDKIYISVGTTIVCHDFWTGERIWTREFQAEFLFSGFIIEDNQLLANCEDGVFYCIDPNTGNIKWHAEGAGTSSPLRYLNGIVYFSGGSTGRIHAIDTNTGEYVWRLEPDKYDNASDFKPDIYVAPGENGKKGKVIICTPEKAYCLPAYR